MTTIAQAIDRATEEGVTVYNDVMIPSKKGHVPDTLTFIVRKGNKSVMCTRQKGTLNVWTITGFGITPRTHTGRGFTIMVAIDLVLGV